jgi:hypothetical protein
LGQQQPWRACCCRHGYGIEGKLIKRTYALIDRGGEGEGTLQVSVILKKGKRKGKRSKDLTRGMDDKEAL